MDKALENGQNDNVREPVTGSEAFSVIEAVLFAAGYPVTYERLAAVLGCTAGEAKRLAAEYAVLYNDENSTPARGVIMLLFDDTCQLCTKEKYGDRIREALGIRRGGNLSQSSVETLAVVAYNEPVTRAFVDTVRGVDSSYAMSSLTDKKLIEPCGRLDVPGRPILYKTTQNFLRVFGLTSLTELPEIPLPSSGLQQAMALQQSASIDPLAEIQETIPEEISG